MPQKTYDIVLSSPFSNYDFFAHKMRELCGQMDLTFFLADDVWVHEFWASCGPETSACAPCWT